MVSLDAAVNLAFLVLLSALLAVLASKFVFRTSPIFFAYVTFNLLVSGFAAMLVERYLPGWYLHFYIFIIVADFIINLYVLAELGKNVLHFNGAESSYWEVACFLFLLAAVGIFSHTEWAVLPHRSLLSDFYYLAMRVSEVLAFAAFLCVHGVEHPARAQMARSRAAHSDRLRIPQPCMVRRLHPAHAVE